MTSGILLDPVEGYLDALRWPADALLDEMERQARDEGIPIVSPQTGQLLSVLAAACRPTLVAEFGTAIGYSTVYIARQLSKTATLVSFEIDPERHRQAGDYLSRAGVRASVELRLGDARELVEDLEGPIDMAFLDATKEQYGEYLESTLAKMEPGGLILVDNALMSGTVARNESDGHWSASSIAAARAFNESFTSDSRITGTVLPVGDGVAVGVRR